MASESPPPVYRLATDADVASAAAAPELAPPGPPGRGPGWWRSRTARIAAVAVAVFVGLPVAAAAVGIVHSFVSTPAAPPAPAIAPAASSSSTPAAEPAATPSPSVSPSEDLLEYPRSMLPCGPRDPFPELHNCSSSASPSAS